MPKHPFSAVPAARSSAPVLKIKLYVVLGAVLLAAALGPISFLLTTAKAGSAGPTTASVDYAAAGYARLVAEDFLSGRATSVPVAEDVDPLFGVQESALAQRQPLPYTGLTLVASEESNDPESLQTYEISKFVFLLGSKPMKLDITMLKTADGPVLAAAPAMRPADLTADKYDRVNYSGSATFEDGAPDGAVGDKVAEWAKAYVSDDRKTLAELTGDPAGGTYAGLGGFELARDAEITSYVVEAPANVPTVNGVAPNQPMYVRVQVWVNPTGAQQSVLSTEYDLLVFDSGTAQPKIVAWGAAGSAPLTPFSNSNRH